MKNSNTFILSISVFSLALHAEKNTYSHPSLFTWAYVEKQMEILHILEVHKCNLYASLMIHPFIFWYLFMSDFISFFFFLKHAC